MPFFVSSLVHQPYLTLPRFCNACKYLLSSTEWLKWRARETLEGMEPSHSRYTPRDRVAGEVVAGEVVAGERRHRMPIYVDIHIQQHCHRSRDLVITAAAARYGAD